MIKNGVEMKSNFGTLLVIENIIVCNMLLEVIASEWDDQGLQQKHYASNMFILILLFILVVILDEY